MSAPGIRCVALTEPAPRASPGAPGRAPRPLVVLGPALGTGVVPLWSGVARLLAGRAEVLGWELPGHGGTAAAGEAFTLAELAQGVLRAVDRALGPGLDGDRGPDAGERGPSRAAGSPFVYAGCSVGGAVGLQLLVDAPRRLSAAAVVAGAPRLGQPGAWRERAELVAAAGTPTQVIRSAQVWFAPSFIERDAAAGTGIATGLLHALQDADRHGYAQVCEALAGFDLRLRLAEISVPVLGIAGAADAAVPPATVRAWTERVPTAGYREIPDAAHLVPAEQPEAVAQQICALIQAPSTHPGAQT